MPKRRKLTDLYKVGKEIAIGDDDGKVSVWLQKLSPVEQETALKRAAAARARLVAAFRDKESEDYLAERGAVEEYGELDVLIELVAVEDLADKRFAIEEKLGAEDEWAKEGYLESLYEAWNGDEETEGLRRAYAEDPEDPEALKVFEELSRFDDLVQKEVDLVYEDLKAEWADADLATIQEKACDILIERKASQHFLDEFQKQQLYFAVRETTDHKQRHFSNPDEVLEVDAHVSQQLIEQFDAMSVEVTEGKDSQEVPTSSTSSKQSDPEETGNSSGQEESAA